MKNKKIALALFPVFWPNMPPLGLACLKGYLEKNGISAKCFDYNNFFFTKADPALRSEWAKSCNRHLEDNILALIKEDFRQDFDRMIGSLSTYEIVSMSCFKSNFTATIGIAQYLKDARPDIKIVFGGPEISRQYFKYGKDLVGKYKRIADFFVVGEGERALLKYITGENTADPIALYDEMDDLCETGIPDYSDFDVEKYPRQKAVSILCSRGCIKKCAFCAEKLLYKKFKTYPVENIIREIAEYRKRGIERFVFHDSLINGDLEALERLCDAIVENFSSVNWEAQIAIRPDMPDKIFQKIKESGCYHLFVGLESGSDRTLERMKKGFTCRDALKFFEKLDQNGLSFGVSVITGFPGESEDDFRQSLDFIIGNKRIIRKIEQVNPFVYYEGIDLPEEYDYRFQAGSVKRAHLFIEKIREHGFKFTNAFMMNLVESAWK
ncbi:MAG: B12-binding domain-containing radical SAM protein [Candidatus Omnitrophica bacterium]|nr:B12-binding domain-containing radical SAM protein [Candidatus Omnitrophota bacterium]